MAGVSMANAPGTLEDACDLSLPRLWHIFEQLPALSQRQTTFACCLVHLPWTSCPRKVLRLQPLLIWLVMGGA